MRASRPSCTHARVLAGPLGLGRSAGGGRVGGGRGSAPRRRAHCRSASASWTVVEALVLLLLLLVLVVVLLLLLPVAPPQPPALCRAARVGGSALARLAGLVGLRRECALESRRCSIA